MHPVMGKMAAIVSSFFIFAVSCILTSSGKTECFRFNDPRSPPAKIELQLLFQIRLSLACCNRKDFEEVHKILDLKI